MQRTAVPTLAGPASPTLGFRWPRQGARGIRMTTRITQRLRISLLGLAALLAACADKAAPPPEPLELTAHRRGHAGPAGTVRVRNHGAQFASYRTYAVELDLQHVSIARCCFSARPAHSFTRWTSAMVRRHVAVAGKPDAYQIAQSQSGQPLPDWHRDAGLNYAQTQRAAMAHTDCMSRCCRCRRIAAIGSRSARLKTSHASRKRQDTIHESRPLAK